MGQRALCDLCHCLSQPPGQPNPRGEAWGGQAGPTGGTEEGRCGRTRPPGLADTGSCLVPLGGRGEGEGQGRPRGRWPRRQLLPGLVCDTWHTARSLTSACSLFRPHWVGVDGRQGAWLTEASARVVAAVWLEGGGPLAGSQFRTGRRTRPQVLAHVVFFHSYYAETSQLTKSLQSRYNCPRFTAWNKEAPVRSLVQGQRCSSSHR